MRREEQGGRSRTQNPERPPYPSRHSMTKATGRLVIWLAIQGVVIGLSAEGYQFVEHRSIEQEVEQARNLASASASPAMVPDDARLWLESNGYRVIYWNPHDHRGFVGMQESSVDGSHVIVEA